MQLTGSRVKIDCVFKDIEEASCVVVYREYGNVNIQVKEYLKNDTEFPLHIDIDDNPEKYTFAVFGKNNSDIDERPITKTRLQITMSSVFLTLSPSTSNVVTSGKYKCS